MDNVDVGLGNNTKNTDQIDFIAMSNLSFLLLSILYFLPFQHTFFPGQHTSQAAYFIESLALTKVSYSYRLMPILCQTRQMCWKLPELIIGW